MILNQLREDRTFHFGMETEGHDPIWINANTTSARISMLCQRCERTEAWTNLTPKDIDELCHALHAFADWLRAQKEAQP